MQKIEIPKQIFDKYFLNKGSVEIESGEKVLHSDTGEIQTAEGNKHKDGGIKTELSDGSQVLSDFTKINAKNSKYFNDIFNINSKPTDTFAKTLDKIETKVGLKKLLEEEKELNLRIEKELQKENPDTQTQDLNMQILSEHSQEINKKKDEIEGVRKIAFQELFEKQEEIPKKNNDETLKQGGEKNSLWKNIRANRGSGKEPTKEMLKQEAKINRMQEGGEQKITPQQIIEAFAEATQKNPQEIVQGLQQMSEEKQQEALSQMLQMLQGQEEQAPQEEQEIMKYGGRLQYAQEGIRVKSKFESSDLYKKQNPNSKSWASFGELLKENSAEVLGEMKRLHPELYGKYFKDDKVPTYDKIKSFQEGVNSKYEDIKKDYVKKYGADSEQVKNLDDAIGKDKFLPMRDEYDEKQDAILNKEIRGTDSFLGNFTSTRPNFSIEVLPKEDLERVNKEGVNTASQLRDKFPDLYDKYVKPQGLNSDFWLGKIAESNNTPIDQPKNEAVQDAVNSNVNRPDRLVLPNIPTYYGQAPTPPEPVYKGDISLQRLEPTKISTEPNLVEAQRQMMGAQGSLEGLSPEQRAVAMQNMYTQNQQATNQAISNAQIANTNSQMQVDQFNIGQAGKEEVANLQNAMSFEQRNLGTKAKYEANLNRYFNNIAAVDKQNWMDVNNLNLLNARSDNFQTDGTNFYRTAENPTFNNPFGQSYAKMSENDKLALLEKEVKDKKKAIAKSQKSAT